MLRRCGGIQKRMLSERQRPRVNTQSELALSRVLNYALKHQTSIFHPNDMCETPVALFYDLDAYDLLIDSCISAFGSNFRHYIAAKANPLSMMLKQAVTKGMGIECASMGELRMAYDRLDCKDVVFDSPAKTVRELRFAIENDIRCHLDNFDEYQRAKDIFATVKKTEGKLGFRINPSSVGAGSIAALSVSTPDSKFGVDAADPRARQRLIEAYAESTFLDSIHVHVGSGGMNPETQLATGVRFALDLALEINHGLGYDQISTIDIGGGLPVNYVSDDFSSQQAPSFHEYAQVLRKTAPELFEENRFTVLTEFGQSLNAKAGFLASTIEFVKKEASRSNNLAIIHFGADLCLRQAYANQDHSRRFAAFDAISGQPLLSSDSKKKTHQKPWSIGGPLCFAGDVLARNLDLPESLKTQDIIVMKDAGANTLSLFSRHCSRLAPPVYGFRWRKESNDPQISEFVLLKPRETIDDLASFWGGPTTTSSRPQLREDRTTTNPIPRPPPKIENDADDLNTGRRTKQKIFAASSSLR